jgi:uncharacterized protein
LSAEPKVEDLLASIRKAIDQDNAARNGAAPPYEQGLMARVPIREMRIAYDKPVQGQEAPSAPKMKVSSLSEDIRTRAEALRDDLAPADNIAPIATRNSGFAEILAGRGEAMPVAPRRRRLDEVPAGAVIEPEEIAPPQYLRKIEEHDVDMQDVYASQPDDWQNEGNEDVHVAPANALYPEQDYDLGPAEPAPLPAVNPYAAPLAAHSHQPVSPHQVRQEPPPQSIYPYSQQGQFQSHAQPYGRGAFAPHEGSHLHGAAAPPALISGYAEQSARRSFEDLANTVMSRALNGRDLEDMTRDMLRIYLSRWLDENLPPLVERIVREEIERVARRGSSPRP